MAAGARPNFFGVPGAERARVPAVLGGRRRAAATAPAGAAAGGDGQRRRAGRSTPADRRRGGRRGPDRGGDRGRARRADRGARTRRAAATRPGRVTIVDRGPALLGAVLGQGATTYALEKLTERGASVTARASASRRCTDDRVELDDGSTIPARTVVWGGGESARRSSQDAGRRAGPRRAHRRAARPDGRRASRGVRRRRRRQHPVGRRRAALPQLGSVAQQSGTWAAENILRELRREADRAVPATRTRASWR